MADKIPENLTMIPKKYKLIRTEYKLKRSYDGDGIKFNLVIKKGTKTGLYQIQALIDIPGRCKIGDLGGLIESEDNLSHLGTSWIDINTVVADHALVTDNAYIETPKFLDLDSFNIICDNAKFYGNSYVDKTSLIISYGNSEFKNSTVTNLSKAKLYGDSHVFDTLITYGSYILFKESTIVYNSIFEISKTVLSGNSIFKDSGALTDKSLLFGNSEIINSTIACGDTKFYENSYIKNSTLRGKGGDIFGYTQIIGATLGIEDSKIYGSTSIIFEIKGYVVAIILLKNSEIYNCIDYTDYKDINRLNYKPENNTILNIKKQYGPLFLANINYTGGEKSELIIDIENSTINSNIKMSINCNSNKKFSLIANIDKSNFINDNSDINIITSDTKEGNIDFKVIESNFNGCESNIKSIGNISFNLYKSNMYNKSNIIVKDDDDDDTSIKIIESNIYGGTLTNSSIKYSNIFNNPNIFYCKNLEYLNISDMSKIIKCNISGSEDNLPWITGNSILNKKQGGEDKEFSVNLSGKYSNIRSSIITDGCKIYNALVNNCNISGGEVIGIDNPIEDYNTSNSMDDYINYIIVSNRNIKPGDKITYSMYG